MDTNETKKTILYAEDDLNFAGLMNILLNEEFPDLQVEHFIDGGQARNRLEKGVQGVLFCLLDHNMPGSNGCDIIKDYATREGYKETPFYLFSGDSRKIGNEAIKNGARKYFLKGMDSTESVVKSIKESLKE